MNDLDMFNVLFDSVIGLRREYENRIKVIESHLKQCSNQNTRLVMSTNIKAYQEFIKDLNKLL